MRRSSLFLALLMAVPLLTVVPPLSAQAPPCPVPGDAKRADVRALNVLKNRTAAITTADIDPRVSVATMLAPGNDLTRWDARRAGRIIGYVRGVRPGGIETVNCHAKAVADRDTHIEIVLSAKNAYDERRMIVVEVTPRSRARAAARGEDWSTAALRRQFLGRTVEVTGWMMFDAEHGDASVNTARSGVSHLWRASGWELHPVMEIRVVQGASPSG